MKNKETLRAFRRIIMLRAWGFFRRGVVSLSLSMKLSWSVAKGVTSEKNLVRKLFKA